MSRTSEDYENEISELKKAVEKWELRCGILKGLLYDNHCDHLVSEYDEQWEREDYEPTVEEEIRFVERDLSLEEMKEMVEIEPCTFMMGALDNDGDAYDEEKPRHAVTLTRKYSIGKYPVTQALWERVMEYNPSEFEGSSRPVEQVSWFDCVAFCNKLSEKEGLEMAYSIDGELPKSHRDPEPDVQCNFDADGYRLPTEAEWECAGRGGESHLYSGSDNIDEVAWYDENSNEETHGVGQKKANGFGLFDMNGNVLEWCWDWYEEYSSAPTEDPTGATTGTFRVDRGGSWRSVAWNSRLSYRGRSGPSYRGNIQGFRLSRTIR